MTFLCGVWRMNTGHESVAAHALTGHVCSLYERLVRGSRFPPRRRRQDGHRCRLVRVSRPCRLANLADGATPCKRDAWGGVTTRSKVHVHLLQRDVGPSRRVLPYHVVKECCGTDHWSYDSANSAQTSLDQGRLLVFSGRGQHCGGLRKGEGAMVPSLPPQPLSRLALMPLRPAGVVPSLLPDVSRGGRIGRPALRPCTLSWLLPAG
jgi:hypothetical protein